MSREKAKEALTCISHSTKDKEIIRKNEEIPEHVDIEMFKHLAQSELGCNFN